MPSNRLPCFQFDVSDYLGDPAVLGMSADAEGIYIRLLARMWQSPTPGRVAVQLLREMGSTGRLADQYRILPRGGPTPSPEDLGLAREAEVLNQVAAAFDLTSEPGYWIQKRMAREWKRARIVSDLKRKGARSTNLSRNNFPGERTLSARLAHAKRTLTGEIVAPQAVRATAPVKTAKMAILDSKSLDSKSSKSKEDSKSESNITSMQAAIVLAQAKDIAFSSVEARASARRARAKKRIEVDGDGPGGFDLAFLKTLQREYPTVKVELVAAKLDNHPKNYRDRARALRAWCLTAREKGWDKRVTFGTEEDTE